MCEENKHLEDDCREALKIAKELTETFLSDKRLEDNKFLAGFTRNNPLAAEVKASLIDVEMCRDLYGKMNSREKEKALSDFRVKIEKLPPPRRKIPPVRRLIAAAVVLPVALALSIYIYYNNVPGHRDHISRVLEDVVLTMADGTAIVIDNNVGNGVIVDQGNIVVDYEDGKLIYEKQTDDTSQTETEWSTIEVPRGTQFQISLEDGTRVWLNAGSRLRFPVSFPHGERSVELEGEAYFAVVADPQRPFTVLTTQQNLQVLGTEFNINAYPDETIVYTTLVSGSVRLKSTAGTARTILRPGEQAMLRNDTDSFSVNSVDTEKTTAWRNGKIVFDEITLDNVFRKLTRWYDFEYEFEDPRAASLTLYGSLPIYDDISHVIELIELSGVTTIKRKGNKLIINMKK